MNRICPAYGLSAIRESELSSGLQFPYGKLLHVEETVLANWLNVLLSCRMGASKRRDAFLISRKILHGLARIQE